jgi:hypothetical protein
VPSLQNDFDRRSARQVLMSGLCLVPLDFKTAAAFVAEHHRHHTPPAGHKFSLGAVQNDKLVGVVIVGRPVARMRDDGATLEVTRLCTDGSRNACSFLYGAAARACFALGYRRIGTYILTSEPGTSLKAAGWKLIGERGGGSWARVQKPHWQPGHTGTGAHPQEQKQLFEIEAA